jgi:hypothetical protein
MREDKVTARQIAQSIEAAAKSFKLHGEIPHEWSMAAPTSQLTCRRQQKAKPRWSCLMCGRIRLYGIRGSCEQCARHVRIFRHRYQRQHDIRPCSKTLYK